MTNLRFYTVVYVALMALATLKVAFFEAEKFGLISYNAAFGLTVVAAMIKTGMIAGYFQHLKWEPRSITYLVLMALFGVLLLSFAATFSIF